MPNTEENKFISDILTPSRMKKTCLSTLCNLVVTEADNAPVTE
ncbi:hypothetical protein LSH36_683g03149, partial [Paralvinella palmiformis]